MGAAVFHEPILSATIKGGTAALLSSTAAEFQKRGRQSREFHSPEKAFDRCHDQLLASVQNYSQLAAGASPEEQIVGRAHFATDAFAAHFTADRLGVPGSKQYVETVKRLQKDIDRGEKPETLAAEISRLHTYAQSIKGQTETKERRSKIMADGVVNEHPSRVTVDVIPEHSVSEAVRLTHPPQETALVHEGEAGKSWSDSTPDTSESNQRCDDSGEEMVQIYYGAGEDRQNGGSRDMLEDGHSKPDDYWWGLGPAYDEKGGSELERD